MPFLGYDRSGYAPRKIASYSIRWPNAMGHLAPFSSKLTNGRPTGSKKYLASGSIRRWLRSRNTLSSCINSCVSSRKAVVASLWGGDVICCSPARAACRSSSRLLMLCGLSEQGRRDTAAAKKPLDTSTKPTARERSSISNIFIRRWATSSTTTLPSIFGTQRSTMGLGYWPAKSTDVFPKRPWRDPNSLSQLQLTTSATLYASGS